MGRRPVVWSPFCFCQTMPGRLRVISLFLSPSPHPLSLSRSTGLLPRARGGGRVCWRGAFSGCIFGVRARESPYHHRKRLLGHSSAVTSLDWSADSQLLQTACGAHEILYWHAVKGTNLRNTKVRRRASRSRRRLNLEAGRETGGVSVLKERKSSRGQTNAAPVQRQARRALRRRKTAFVPRAAPTGP